MAEGFAAGAVAPAGLAGLGLAGLGLVAMGLAAMGLAGLGFPPVGLAPMGFPPMGLASALLGPAGDLAPTAGARPGDRSADVAGALVVAVPDAFPEVCPEAPTGALLSLAFRTALGGGLEPTEDAPTAPALEGLEEDAAALPLPEVGPFAARPALPAPAAAGFPSGGPSRPTRTLVRLAVEGRVALPLPLETPAGREARAPSRGRLPEDAVDEAGLMVAFAAVTEGDLPGALAEALPASLAVDFAGDWAEDRAEDWAEGLA